MVVKDEKCLISLEREPSDRQIGDGKTSDELDQRDLSVAQKSELFSVDFCKKQHIINVYRDKIGRYNILTQLGRKIASKIIGVTVNFVNVSKMDEKRSGGSAPDRKHAHRRQTTASQDSKVIVLPTANYVDDKISRSEQNKTDTGSTGFD